MDAEDGRGLEACIEKVPRPLLDLGIAHIRVVEHLRRRQRRCIQRSTDPGRDVVGPRAVDGDADRKDYDEQRCCEQNGYRAPRIGDGRTPYGQCSVHRDARLPNSPEPSEGEAVNIPAIRRSSAHRSKINPQIATSGSGQCQRVGASLRMQLWLVARALRQRSPGCPRQHRPSSSAPMGVARSRGAAR